MGQIGVRNQHGPKGLWPGLPTAAWLLGLLLVVAACGGQKAPSPFERGGQSDRVSLQVENLDFNEATLHAVIEGGGRSLIGRVAGKSNGSFVLEWAAVRDLQIQIDLLASDRYTTPRLTVSPGDRITLVIQTPVNRSYLRR
ncbi:MAG: hypothetical protein R3E10_02355 [Gemmatimonadota bacterium]